MKASRKLKLLMLEDLSEDVELICHELKKNGFDYFPRVVDDEKDFIEALTNFKPDVILSDHSLPRFNSIEALKICKRYGLRVPFILVTGTVSEEFAVNCLKQGADDYVLKSNLARLPSAIRNAIDQKIMREKKLKAELALRKQNEELIKINNELDSFVYSTSHNLRAPLMSILGLANLAKNEKEKTVDLLLKYVSMIESSINKLDETLKEILDYSKNARNDLKIGNVDLKELTKKSIDSMKYLEHFSQLSINTQIIEKKPFYADVYRLSVIFNNLISNAIKYIDPIKDNNYLNININISAKKAILKFEDNGIGIEQDYIDKIFNIFYRATEKSSGAGLGLYIVQEMVVKLKGNIKVNSQKGEGTTFVITIPNHSPETDAFGNEK